MTCASSEWQGPPAPVISSRLDVFDVHEMWRGDDGQQVKLGEAEIRFDIYAAALDGNDVVDYGGHVHVVHCGDELLTAVNHTHDLPAGLAVSRHASINGTFHFWVTPHLLCLVLNHYTLQICKVPFMFVIWYYFLTQMADLSVYIVGLMSHLDDIIAIISKWHWFLLLAIKQLHKDIKSHLAKRVGQLPLDLAVPGQYLVYPHGLDFD